jgi:hypothetical protein
MGLAHPFGDAVAEDGDAAPWRAAQQRREVCDRKDVGAGGHAFS